MSMHVTQSPDCKECPAAHAQGLVFLTCVVSYLQEAQSDTA